MSSQRATADASVLDYRETHSQERVDGAEWRVTGLECQCGADITEWHSRAEARRLVRMYGVDGRVLACPACQDPRNGIDEDLGTVPKAVSQSQREATAEFQSRSKLALREVRSDE